MNTSLSLSASGFLITSLQLILRQKQDVRGRVSKKKRKEREGERERQPKAQSWKSNATIRCMLSVAEIQRQYSKVTLQSVDNTGTGPCTISKVETKNLSGVSFDSAFFIY